MPFEITLSIHPEEIPVRGNAIASDDPEADRELENDIIDRLNCGDLWAWCTVQVTVSCGGLSESEYLGGCCYADEADFRIGGYYDGMVSECKARLIAGARAVLAAAGEEG